MNNLKPILGVLLLCTTPIHAKAPASAPATSAETKLVYRPHLGGVHAHTLTIHANEITVDGVTMDPAMALTKGGTIAVLLEAPPKAAPPRAPCAAGTFEHTVHFGNQTTIEKDCMESDRFTELESAYEFLNAE